MISILCRSDFGLTTAAYRLDTEKYQKDREKPLHITNKCYAVVAPKQALKHFQTIIKKLTAHIKEYPI